MDTYDILRGVEKRVLQVMSGRCDRTQEGSQKKMALEPNAETVRLFWSRGVGAQPQGPRSKVARGSITRCVVSDASLGRRSKGKAVARDWAGRAVAASSGAGGLTQARSLLDGHRDRWSGQEDGSLLDGHGDRWSGQEDGACWRARAAPKRGATSRA